MDVSLNIADLPKLGIVMLILGGIWCVVNISETVQKFLVLVTCPCRRIYAMCYSDDA